MDVRIDYVMKDLNLPQEDQLWGLVGSHQQISDRLQSVEYIDLDDNKGSFDSDPIV